MTHYAFPLPNTNLVMAANVRWQSCAHRFAWAQAHGLAVEFGPDPDNLHLMSRQTEVYRASGWPLRYHGFFPNHELGNSDPGAAGAALAVHCAATDAIGDLGGGVMTVHVNLCRSTPFDPDVAQNNLNQLVAHAQSRGVTISLENLRAGFASHPEKVVEMALVSGAMLTLDIGHAVCCARVQQGEITPLDFVSLFRDRLEEVHMYGKETDRHYPGEDAAAMGPLLESLLDTRCRWWTIELDYDEEALATRDKLVGYLRPRVGELRLSSV
jgi:sugar phosphate isomerase/epimerase